MSNNRLCVGGIHFYRLSSFIFLHFELCFDCTFRGGPLLIFGLFRELVLWVLVHDAHADGAFERNRIRFDVGQLLWLLFVFFIEIIGVEKATALAERLDSGSCV